MTFNSWSKKLNIVDDYKVELIEVKEEEKKKGDLKVDTSNLKDANRIPGEDD